MVVVDGVHVFDVALLVGGMKVSGGSDESSEVRITATISIPTSRTAAAPATYIVPGRFDQCSGSWSGDGTPECYAQRARISFACPVSAACRKGPKLIRPIPSGP